MLERLRDLASRSEDFAFETTLSSRSFAPFRGTQDEHEPTIQAQHR
jgi:hypothetical protein